MIFDDDEVECFFKQNQYEELNHNNDSQCKESENLDICLTDIVIENYSLETYSNSNFNEKNNVLKKDSKKDNDQLQTMKNTIKPSNKFELVPLKYLYQAKRLKSKHLLEKKRGIKRIYYPKQVEQPQDLVQNQKMLKNRMSAQKSLQKKQNIFMELKQEKENLVRENLNLKNENDILKSKLNRVCDNCKKMVEKKELEEQQKILRPTYSFNKPKFGIFSSTILLCFIVCFFNFSSTLDKNNTAISMNPFPSMLKVNRRMIMNKIKDNRDNNLTGNSVREKINEESFQNKMKQNHFDKISHSNHHDQHKFLKEINQNIYLSNHTMSQLQKYKKKNKFHYVCRNKNQTHIRSLMIKKFKNENFYDNYGFRKSILINEFKNFARMEGKSIEE